MSNNIIWPTSDFCPNGKQKYVARSEPRYSTLCGKRTSRFSGLKVFAAVLALSSSTLLGAAVPATATDADTPITRAEMQEAKKTIKTLRMKLAEVKKDRAALLEQLERESSQIAKQIEEVFSKSWKSDPEVVILRGKLDAAGKQFEEYAAASRDSAAEIAALKTKLKAAASQIDALGKEKGGALSEVSKLKHDLAGALNQVKQLEVERSKLVKSELARKAAVQKLAMALTDNKTQDKQLLAARNTAKKFRAKLEAADTDIANLEIQLEKSSKERDALKTQLDETQNEIGQRIEKVFEAASQETRKSKQQIEQLVARIESVESEKSELKKVFAAASQETRKAKQQIEQLAARVESVENEKSELKQQYARLRQQAAKELEKAVKDSRAESERASRAEIERLNKQVQAAMAKANSASESGRIIHVLYRQSVKERAQVEQAAAKEAETLRAQLATSKRQIADAQAEVKTARAELAERIEKLISAAAALTVTEVSGLKDKLAAANSEIIVRLKAVRAEK